MSNLNEGEQIARAIQCAHDPVYAIPRHMSVETGDVTFTVTNEGGEDRGFKISGPRLERSFTAPLPAGES